MSDFIGKLSTYHFFNYLFTGVLFVVTADQFTSFSFVQSDLVLAPFVYYFIGLIVSRIGSLVVEPVLKKIKFVNFAEYGRYVSASKADVLIETLSETNNMYRTLCALFLCVILLNGYSLMEQAWPVLQNETAVIVIGGLFLMFLFAYRKQTNYITKRIAKNI